MREGLLLILFLIFLASLCDTINQLFIKSAVNSLQVSLSANVIKIIRFILRLIRVPQLWLGGLFSLLSLCIWLVVLSKADLNFAFSVDSMHYILIALASRLILKERVDSKRWLGTLLIVIGIIIVSLS